MILVDANLLIYAHMSGMPRHEQGKSWLDDRLAGTQRVGLPWPSLLAFVRLTTNRRIFERPQTMEGAWTQVREWLQQLPVWVPLPTDRHHELLGKLLGQIGQRPNLVADAHLAALAMEHGLLLCSADRDFARFSGLRWENPLERDE